MRGILPKSPNLSLRSRKEGDRTARVLLHGALGILQGIVKLRIVLARDRLAASPLSCPLRADLPLDRSTLSSSSLFARTSSNNSERSKLSTLIP